MQKLGLTGLLWGPEAPKKRKMAKEPETFAIDCQSMFDNYANFIAWHNDKRPEQLGGLIFARRTRKEIVLVLFFTAADLTETNLEFVLSCLSADVELVGRVAVDKSEVPQLGDGFEVDVTTETLENRDQFAFFLNNGHFLKQATIGSEGLSMRSKVAFECSLRPGTEADDIRKSAHWYSLTIDRFAFHNKEHSILLLKQAEKDKRDSVLNEIARGTLQYKDFLEFTGLRSLTRNTSEDIDDQKIVPVVKITRDGKKYQRLTAVLELTVPAYFGENSFVLFNRLMEGIKRRLRNLVHVYVSGFKKTKTAFTTESLVFCPQGWSTLLNIQMPQLNEDESKAFRTRLHKTFNLPAFTPCLRVAQALPFSSAAAKLLKNPHESITNYKRIGRISVVKGSYNYHHYMQDKMDDSGWGCAYRSMQTIWSWFILNGFTDKKVPTHREIQQCLVDIGDKEEKFVGSRQWIGSTEIGFVLDTLLSIESKFIITNSGAEVPEHARELAHHFETAGTPVMIGGGQLAHTILGVDFNEDTGEVKFLVLDPHYTGGEDIRTILSKGWCAWKPASFWRPDSFYNMVLPQPPPDSI